MFVEQMMRASSTRMTLLLGCLLVGPVLAGCFGGTDPDTEQQQEAVIRVDGRLPCDPEVISNCDELVADPDAPILLIPFDIESTKQTAGSDFDAAQEESRKGGRIGLLLTYTTRDVILRDSHIIGFEVGILVQEIDCPACTINFENVAIKGSSGTFESETGDLMFSTVSGMRFENVTADVNIIGTRIHLPGGGWFEYNTGSGSVQWFPSAEGVWAEGYSGRFKISGLQLEGANQTGGWGVQIRGAKTDVFITGLKIENFGTCLDTRVSNLEIRNVSLTNCVIGADFNGPTIDGAASSVSVQQLDVHDAHWFGVIVRLSDYNVCQGPPDAGHLEAPANFKLHDSQIRNAGLTGLLVWYSTAAVERSRFADNGHGFEEGSSPADEVDTGGVINNCGIATVQESVFTDNTAFGYKGEQWDDATNNWWGSPLGPSLQDPFLLLPQATGDPIDPEVRYLPFLAEEPDHRFR